MTLAYYAFLTVDGYKDDSVVTPHAVLAHMEDDKTDLKQLLRQYGVVQYSRVEHSPYYDSAENCDCSYSLPKLL